MNPTVVQGQLTQIFDVLHTAQVAYAAERQKSNTSVRLYQMTDFQVDDLRPNPPLPGAYQASGNPLYVVQSDYM